MGGNLSNLQTKSTSRLASNVKYARQLVDQLMYGSVFTCVVLIDKLDIANRTFEGSIFPGRAANIINDNSKNSQELVSDVTHFYRGVGIVPEGVNINTLQVNKSLVVCLSMDFSIKEIYTQARVAKMNPATSTINFVNHVKALKGEKVAHDNQNLIIITKLIDL